ncbi:unnamed protein product [Adineta ricciae]|nr:unnamed protein product [Adineta ricciae]
MEKRSKNPYHFGKSLRISPPHEIGLTNKRRRNEIHKKRNPHFYLRCYPCPCSCPCVFLGILGLLFLCTAIAAILIGMLIKHPSTTTTISKTTFTSVPTATSATAFTTVSTTVITTAPTTASITVTTTVSMTPTTTVSMTPTTTVSMTPTTTVSMTTITTTITSTTTSVTISVGNWSSTGTVLVGATELNNQWGLIFDSSDTLYIADRLNHRILKLPMNATNATTLAGTYGTSGSTASLLNEPTCVQLDSNGNMYIADRLNNRIQYWAKGASSGTTVAGAGGYGSGNNQLDSPYGISLDTNSNTLYIADFGNDRIMCYLYGSSSGTVVAGNNGQGCGSTQLSRPVGVLFETSTNSLVIVNSECHNIIRWVLGASSWTLIVGSLSGTPGSSATQLNTPEGVVFDPTNNLYVADRYNHRVQFYLAGQTTGKTVVGTTGVSGANTSLLNNPYAVALDSQLNLYVSDRYNNRVLKFARL